jgi:hypothetical protein
MGDSNMTKIALVSAALCLVGCASETPTCNYHVAASPPTGEGYTFGSQADDRACQPFVSFANGAWQGTQVGVVKTTESAVAMMIIAWSGSPPAADTTYVLPDSTSSLFVKLQFDKVSRELDGSYDTLTNSASRATVKVGAFKLEEGGRFEFEIAPGSVVAGPNGTSVNLSGSFSGVFEQQ